MSKWELAKLQDICEIITDGTHQTPQYVDKGYIFLSSKNVTSKFIDWENVKYIPEELHNDLYKRIKPQKGDILLAKNGTTGVAAIVDKDEVFDIYVSLALLRPKSEIYAPYLLSVINSPYAKRQFNKSLKGIGVPNLHLKEIRNAVVPTPPFDIQKHIADILDKMQEIIDGHKKQLKELDNLIKATFYDMFGDPIMNDKQWRIISFNSIINKANNGLSRRGTIHDTNGNIVLRLKELQSNYIDYSEVNRINLYESEKDRYLLYQDDILFARVNGNPDNVGRCATFNEIEENVYHNDHIIRVTLEKGKVKNEYLCYILNSEYGKREFKDKLKTSAGQYTINQVGLGNVIIPLPPLELQNKFAQIVMKIEEQKALVKQSITQSQNLFNSLMSKYFD